MGCLTYSYIALAILYVDRWRQEIHGSPAAVFLLFSTWLGVWVCVSASVWKFVCVSVTKPSIFGEKQIASGDHITGMMKNCMQTKLRCSVWEFVFVDCMCCCCSYDCQCLRTGPGTAIVVCKTFSSVTCGPVSFVQCGCVVYVLLCICGTKYEQEAEKGSLKLGHGLWEIYTAHSLRLHFYVLYI